MTRERHSISFEPLAAVYDATRGGVERGEGFARDLAPFVGAGSRGAGGTILEVGVGTGAVAQPLARLTGRTVVGIDLSPAMLAHAVGRIGGRAVIGDAGRLPVADRSVEAVVMVWVLQLVPDIGHVLAEAYRVLRPGGRLAAVLSRPDERPCDIQYLQRLLFERLGPQAGDGPHQVADHAREQGFSLVEQGRTTEVEWDQTPVQAAERLEQRTFASLLELDEDRFDEVVLPIAREMRALPEPDRPRHRGDRHHFLVCERPADAGVAPPRPPADEDVSWPDEDPVEPSWLPDDFADG